MRIKLIYIYHILCALLVMAIAGSATAATDSLNTSIIQELNDSTVNESISQHPFFILNVYKQICNPCQRMKAALDELSRELDGQAAIGMIDGRKNLRTESGYNITSYPTLLVFDNGTLIDKMPGFASKKYIVDRLRMKNPNLNTSRVRYT